MSPKTIERTCEYCGQVFYVIPSRLNHGRGKHCSPECQYEAIKKRAFKKRIKFTCLNCGKIFGLCKSVAMNKKGTGKYCSRKCRDEHWIGENHPQFIDGNGVNYHGPNWYAQRRKALKRDKHACRGCGITKKESIQRFGQPLVVHHITPFRYYKGDYKKANKLSNLITLCHSCHRKIEADIQRNEK